MTAPTVTRLDVWVPGRPAPKGSYHRGEHGQIREASAYLPAWAGEWVGGGKARRRRAGAVERAIYEQYHALGIPADALPLFRGPVWCELHFVLTADQRVDGPPDLDKLVRATWDALTVARVWEDDGRVVRLTTSKAQQPETEFPTGARISIGQVHP